MHPPLKGALGVAPLFLVHFSRSEREKEQIWGLGCRSKPLLRTRRGSWTSQASRARAGVDGETEGLPSEKEGDVGDPAGAPCFIAAPSKGLKM